MHGVQMDLHGPQVSPKEQFQPMLAESADPILELEIKKFIVLWLRKGICFFVFKGTLGLEIVRVGCNLGGVILRVQSMTRWWFQIFLFAPTWGNDPI